MSMKPALANEEELEQEAQLTPSQQARMRLSPTLAGRLASLDNQELSMDNEQATEQSVPAFTEDMNQDAQVELSSLQNVAQQDQGTEQTPQALSDLDPESQLELTPNEEALQQLPDDLSQAMEQAPGRSLGQAQPPLSDLMDNPQEQAPAADRSVGMETPQLSDIERPGMEARQELSPSQQAVQHMRGKSLSDLMGGEDQEAGQGQGRGSGEGSEVVPNDPSWHQAIPVNGMAPPKKDERSQAIEREEYSRRRSRGRSI